MTTKPTLEPAYTARDLMVLTGFGRQKVLRMMRDGKLPGIVDGRSYSCPRSLWEAYCEGRWHPKQTAEAQPVAMVHRRRIA